MHLVINSYGAKLSRKRGMFQVNNKDGEKKKFSVFRLSSITLTRACSLTTDALELAVKHDIPVVLVRPNGKMVASLSSPKYGSELSLWDALLPFGASLCHCWA